MDGVFRRADLDMKWFSVAEYIEEDAHSRDYLKPKLSRRRFLTLGSFHNSDQDAPAWNPSKNGKGF